MFFFLFGKKIHQARLKIITRKLSGKPDVDVHPLGPYPNEATTAKSGGIAKVPPKAKADVPLSKITMAKADEFGSMFGGFPMAVSAENVTFFLGDG